MKENFYIYLFLFAFPFLLLVVLPLLFTCVIPAVIDKIFKPKGERQKPKKESQNFTFSHNIAKEINKETDIFSSLWADAEFRDYIANNNIPLEFITNLIDKISELANKEYEAKLDEINNSAMESILNWQKENEQLKQSKNALVIQLEQDISELNGQIKKMKSCFNCKHKEDCVIEDYNSKCDKWEYTK